MYLYVYKTHFICTHVYIWHKDIAFYRFTVTTRCPSTWMAHMAEWVMIPDMTQCNIWQKLYKYAWNFPSSSAKVTKKIYLFYFAVGHCGTWHILTRPKSEQLPKVIFSLFSKVYFQICLSILEDVIYMSILEVEMSILEVEIYVYSGSWLIFFLFQRHWNPGAGLQSDLLSWKVFRIPNHYHFI